MPDSTNHYSIQVSTKNIHSDCLIPLNTNSNSDQLAVMQFFNSWQSPEIFSDFHSETCTLVKQCSIHRKFYSCPNRCLPDVHQVPKVILHSHHFQFKASNFATSTCPVNDSSPVLQKFLPDELETTTCRRLSELYEAIVLARFLVHPSSKSKPSLLIIKHASRKSPAEANPV